MKKTLGAEAIPLPLLPDVRALILEKCRPDKAPHVRAIVEQQPFGELERLVTQKLLDVAKHVARNELKNEEWIRTVAKLAGRSYEATRVRALEFLDRDIFHLTIDDCQTFLEPLIQSWDIDLATFGLQVVLNRRVTAQAGKRFEYVERPAHDPLGEEPGFKAFREDPSLSGTATEEELTWLRQLTFRGRRPTPLFYYRELQNLKDPLHFAAQAGVAS